MNAHLFSSFARMIDDFPASGIIWAAVLERQMVENDLACKRSLPMREADSILSFCRFLDAARKGVEIVPGVLPLEHMAFYRKTVERLIAAGELSVDAREKFDAFVSAQLFKSLNSAH